MSWKKPILLAILFYPFHNQLHAQPSTPPLFDVLKSFQVGREWTYRYGITGSPSYNFFFDTTSVFPSFHGFRTVKVASISLDSTNGTRTFHLEMRTTGTRELINWRGGVISRDQIDSVDSTSIVEDFSLSWRAGRHHIKGWIFDDSLGLHSIRCLWDTVTIYCPYLRYYRYYDIASQDTFELRRDTLVLRTQWSDCHDLSLTTTYSIVPDSGVVVIRYFEFNYFGWSITTSLTCLGSGMTNVKEKLSAPADFTLCQNYPNPFNSETIVEYSIPTKGLVYIEVYNVLGQKVRTLISLQQESGRHQVMWDARDDVGRTVSSGVYLIRMRYNNRNQVIHAVYLR